MSRGAPNALTILITFKLGAHYRVGHRFHSVGPILSVRTDVMKGLLNERGQTTTEFGFVLILVVIVAVAAVGALGPAIVQLWHSFVSAWPA